MALLRHLIGAEAFLGRAIEVRISLVLQLVTGLEEGLGQRIEWRDILDPERAIRAVKLTGAAGLVFHFLEGGQGALPVPALRTVSAFPLVKILVGTAHVVHRIDRGRAAQRLAARPEQLAVVQMFLLLGPIAPVEGLTGDGVLQQHRRADYRAVIRAAGLEHTDGDGRIAGEAFSDGAAGRTGPTDNIVVARLTHGLSP